MEKGTLIAVIAAVCVFSLSFALTEKEKPTAKNGKALFSSTIIGTNGKTCTTCHPGGKGLESVAVKSEWSAGGDSFDSMEGAINACVRGALGGCSLSADSLETQSLVSYLDRFRATVKAPAPAAEAEEEDDEDKFGC